MLLLFFFFAFEDVFFDEGLRADVAFEERFSVVFFDFVFFVVDTFFVEGFFVVVAFFAAAFFFAVRRLLVATTTAVVATAAVTAAAAATSTPVRAVVSATGEKVTIRGESADVPVIVSTMDCGVNPSPAREIRCVPA